MSKSLSSFFFLFLSIAVYGQKINGKLQFEKGQTLAIQMKLEATVTQQAMENAISFLAGGSALYHYKIIDTKDDNTTLRHEAQNISFKFDGMGQKRSFNSYNTADMSGQFGEPIKKILEKKFDMVIDQNGKVLMTIPANIEPVKTDERLTIVLNMIKDISDVVYPPQKGEASFFKVLPEKEISIGENWTDSIQNETGKIKTTYTLTGITDTTVVIDFTSNSVTVAKTLMMGRETTTTLNSTGTGKIILNKATGLVKEKTTTTESNGTMEAMGGSTPVTSKTTIVIQVKPE